jgi:hypothetical protein
MKVIFIPLEKAYLAAIAPAGSPVTSFSRRSLAPSAPISIVKINIGIQNNFIVNLDKIQLSLLVRM